MKRICPSCNYVRKASDDVPEWQCPSCGKAYSRYDKALAGTSVPKTTVRPTASSGSGILNWLLVLVVIGAGGWMEHSFWADISLRDTSPLSSLALQQECRQPEVLMYATARCPYCVAARKFFKSNGIRFTELDIERSREADARNRKLGARGVPTFVIDGEPPIFGFNEQRLRERLKPWLKKV